MIRCIPIVPLVAQTTTVAPFRLCFATADRARSPRRAAPHQRAERGQCRAGRHGRVLTGCQARSARSPAGCARQNVAVSLVSGVRAQTADRGGAHSTGARRARYILFSSRHFLPFLPTVFLYLTNVCHALHFSRPPDLGDAAAEVSKRRLILSGAADVGDASLSAFASATFAFSLLLDGRFQVGFCSDSPTLVAFG